jgi:hypothetical protein
MLESMKEVASMGEALAYREEFYDALESAKRNFDVGLIYLIHVLQSPKIAEDQKREYCDRLVEIGREAAAYFSSVKLGDITQYNIREYEQRIMRELGEACGSIAAYTGAIDRKLSPVIDRGARFSIDDIVKKLGGSRIHGEYALTKDRLDNLLVIRRFIIDFYESMVGSSASRGKKLDKDFYELRLKTFLGGLRGRGNRNPDFAFLAISLCRKLVLDGTEVAIADPGKDLANRSELFIFIGGEDKIAIAHSFGGTSIRCEVARAESGAAWKYRLTGFVEMKGERVEFAIDEDVLKESLQSFEHLLGLDFVWAQYDKAFLAYSRDYNELKDRSESLGKQKIKDAAFDILFG